MSRTARVVAILCHRKTKQVRTVHHIMKAAHPTQEQYARDRISAAYPGEDIQHIEAKGLWVGQQTQIRSGRFKT